MKKYFYAIIVIVILACIAGSTILFFMWRNERFTRIREERNVQSLTDTIHRIRLNDGTEVTEKQILQMTVREMKNTNGALVSNMKDLLSRLDIKIRNLESASAVNFESTTKINTFLRDSIIFDTIPIKYLTMTSKFNDVNITVYPNHNDSISFQIITRGTMTQFISKVPRDLKFWTAEWWQRRKLQQTVHFDNPDVRIKYNEFIQIGKRKKDFK